MSPAILLRMLLLTVAATSVVCGPFNDLNVFGYNPAAAAEASVHVGPARFTVLTDSVIRMEYSHTQTFEDRATLLMVNRRLPIPNFTQTTENGYLTITTKQVTLKYQLNQGFASWSLSAKFASGQSWVYGDVDRGNLFGAIRSIDDSCILPLNCTENGNTYVRNELLHCGWGVVSRGGWTVVDDSGNYILSSVEGEWFDNKLKSRDDTDMYLFGHGHNYRQALYDYTRIAGYIPLLQKPMLGAWHTRWYDYDAHSLKSLLRQFNVNDLPLDVVTLDMNWHTKDGWTGFSWDRQLFPYPNDTLAELHAEGLLVGGNIHDADGLGKWEETYAQMCSATGHANNGDTIPFQPLNEKYMRGLGDITLKQSGFDFTWPDWQQGGTAGGMNGDRMNPTFLVNHVRGTDFIRRKENLRDAVLARWGGMGSHRYPVGFSGDVSSLSWECFAYQPFYSVVAANVGYGWSHDLVGPADNHELHVRWIQFGAYSSVLRLHDRGMSAGDCAYTGNCAVVNVWELPTRFFEPIRTVMQKRVALLPYIYTAQRQAFETGVSLVYPLYYDWPEQGAAYTISPNGEFAEYMFGPDMLVSPITRAGDMNTKVSSKSIWLPPGLWYDDVFGVLMRGGGNSFRQSYHLNDVPVFFRAGAIVPRLPNPSKVGVASKPFDDLDIYIYPGASSGSFRLYEDDGASLDYLKGEFAYTTISYTRTADSVSVTVSELSKAFRGCVTTRKLRFFLVQTMPLSEAQVDGAAVPYQRSIPKSGSTLGYSYDGATASVVISIGKKATSKSVSITCRLALKQNEAALQQIKGFVSYTELAKVSMDDVRKTPGSTNVGNGYVKRAASYSEALSYLAGADIPAFARSVGTPFRDLVVAALKECGGSPPTPAPVDDKLVQMWHEGRKDMLLCSSRECQDVNRDYKVMWTEGYQPDSSSADSIALNDYWSDEYKDNYATTLPEPPAGYVMATFSDGVVLRSSANGTSCLQVWVSATTHDHMTFSSAAGLRWAQEHNYIKIASCIGYAFDVPQPHARHQRARLRSDPAFDTAISLLTAALEAQN